MIGSIMGIANGGQGIMPIHEPKLVVEHKTGRYYLTWYLPQIEDYGLRVGEGLGRVLRDNDSFIGAKYALSTSGVAVDNIGLYWERETEALTALSSLKEVFAENREKSRNKKAKDLPRPWDKLKAAAIESGEPLKPKRSHKKASKAKPPVLEVVEVALTPVEETISLEEAVPPEPLPEPILVEAPTTVDEVVSEVVLLSENLSVQHEAAIPTLKPKRSHQKKVPVVSQPGDVTLAASKPKRSHQKKQPQVSLTPSEVKTEGTKPKRSHRKKAPPPIVVEIAAE